VVESNLARVHLRVVTHDFHNGDVGSKWGSKLQETYRCVSSLVCLTFVFILHILCLKGPNG
jgi:hypothetical protein